MTGTVGGDVKVGDTVTVTVNGDSATPARSAGLTFSIDVAGSDLCGPTPTVHASVTATDAAGNTTTATDDQAYTVDTVAPVASITLDAITADNIVNAAEAGGTVAVTGTVGGDVQVGDTVTLTVNGNPPTPAWCRRLDLQHRRCGQRSCGSDTNVHASVTATDAAGNATTATDDQAYTVDTVAPAASITARRHHGRQHRQRGGGWRDGCGDRHGGRRRQGRRHRHPDGQRRRLHRPGAGGLTFSIDVAGSELVADPDLTVHASVTTTDAAGNTTTATDDQAYTVDTVAPVASITLDAITADNIVNAAEAGGTVAVTGTVGGDVRTATRYPDGQRQSPTPAWCRLASLQHRRCGQRSCGGSDT